MDLKNFTKHLIYQSANTQIPDNFSRFQILHPEYSAHESVVKTYPLPENEHLFSLLWDIHDGHMLSATILPSQPSFLYEKEFTPGMRTQMHSHEYLELFHPSVRLPPLPEGENADIAGAISVPSVPSSGTS